MSLFLAIRRSAAVLVSGGMNNEDGKIRTPKQKPMRFGFGFASTFVPKVRIHLAGADVRVSRFTRVGDPTKTTYAPPNTFALEKR